jgi:hypothetical protein
MPLARRCRRVRLARDPRVFSFCQAPGDGRSARRTPRWRCSPSPGGGCESGTTPEERRERRQVYLGNRDGRVRHRSEQAAHRSEQAGHRSEQAGHRSEQAGHRSEQAGHRSEQAGTRWEQAGTRWEHLRSNLGMLRSNLGMLLSNLGMLRSNLGVLWLFAGTPCEGEDGIREGPRGHLVRRPVPDPFQTERRGRAERLSKD